MVHFILLYLFDCWCPGLWQPEVRIIDDCRPRVDLFTSYIFERLERHITLFICFEEVSVCRGIERARLTPRSSFLLSLHLGVQGRFWFFR